MCAHSCLWASCFLLSWMVAKAMWFWNQRQWKQVSMSPTLQCVLERLPKAASRAFSLTSLLNPLSTLTSPSALCCLQARILISMQPSKAICSLGNEEGERLSAWPRSCSETAGVQTQDENPGPAFLLPDGHSHWRDASFRGRLHSQLITWASSFLCHLGWNMDFLSHCTVSVSKACDLLQDCCTFFFP
jgi:hypothetical protein